MFYVSEEWWSKKAKHWALSVPVWHQLLCKSSPGDTTPGMMTAPKHKVPFYIIGCDSTILQFVAWLLQARPCPPGIQAVSVLPRPGPRQDHRARPPHAEGSYLQERQQTTWLLIPRYAVLLDVSELTEPEQGACSTAQLVLTQHQSKCDAGLPVIGITFIAVVVVWENVVYCGFFCVHDRWVSCCCCLVPAQMLAQTSFLRPPSCVWLLSRATGTWWWSCWSLEPTPTWQETMESTLCHMLHRKDTYLSSSCWQLTEPRWLRQCLKTALEM